MQWAISSLPLQKTNKQFPKIVKVVVLWVSLNPLPPQVIGIPIANKNLASWIKENPNLLAFLEMKTNKKISCL